MTQTLISVAGYGLITGKPVSVTIGRLPPGSGIQFIYEGTTLPATPEFVSATSRGVTLLNHEKRVSIVEHFLSACAMLDLTDLAIDIEGAPELPLMDGSAAPWIKALHDLTFAQNTPSKRDSLILDTLVTYVDPQHPQTQLLAIPCDQLKITYLVHFPHPDLQHRWFHWQAEQHPLIDAISSARTFGFASELPAMQAQGMALGVTEENTVGLLETGGYTTTLRFPDEPLRHKVLDLIGDLMLCQVPIQRLKAHLIVYYGGHTSHIPFGKKLSCALQSQ